MIRSLVVLAAAGAAAAYFYSRGRGRRSAPPAEAPVDDRRVEEGIRAKLAEVVAEPGAVHVTVRAGMASLRGPVLPGERDRALAAVLEVPGVLLVKNFLEPVEPAPAST